MSWNIQERENDVYEYANMGDVHTDWHRRNGDVDCPWDCQPDDYEEPAFPLPPAPRGARP